MSPIIGLKCLSILLVERPCHKHSQKLLLQFYWKDPKECGPYGQILLLNRHVKILAKLLAISLYTVMTDIISMELNCFIGRLHSFTNIRRPLSVVHSSTSSQGGGFLGCGEGVQPSWVAWLVCSIEKTQNWIKIDIIDSPSICLT